MTVGLLFFDCQNMNNNEDKQKLVIKYKNKQFLFKENIYLFNTSNVWLAFRYHIYHLEIFQ